MQYTKVVRMKCVFKFIDIHDIFMWLKSSVTVFFFFFVGMQIDLKKVH